MTGPSPQKLDNSAVDAADAAHRASSELGGVDPKVLLAESRQLRGVSLWQDASRRLRRSLTARWSLRLLIGAALLTIVTPILPLQSPVLQNLKKRQFEPPNMQAVRLGFSQWKQDLAELDSRLAEASAADRPALEQKREQLADSDPFRTLWHRPGFLTRKMIEMRLAIFGDWCVPSICGCDSLGRDVLARICWGARVSLVVGVVASLVSLLIGVSYGATSGYLGGWVDDVMMRIVDILYSIPFIFVVIFLLTILSEPSIKKTLNEYHIDQMVIFYLVIGAIYWLTMARVVRGQVLSLKNEQFIEAARTIGASRTRIIFRHIVPNVMSVVIVYLTLTIPAVMLFEAFLSFLGLGVSPPDVSLGLLINEGIQVITPVKTFAWLIIFPGLALTLTLFALNFLGDGLRDALDPRLKNR
ncbi:MAG: ABC transporter permease [Pirellulales bacterium]